MQISTSVGVVQVMWCRHGEPVMVLAPQRGALLPGSGQHNATSVTMDVGRYRELGVIEEMALADLLVVDVIRSPGSTLSHTGKRTS
jgi:hypothetical protein